MGIQNIKGMSGVLEIKRANIINVITGHNIPRWCTPSHNTGRRAKFR